MTRLPLREFIAEIQHCPRCQRACNVEHVGTEEQPASNTAIVLIFCEECVLGHELTYYWQVMAAGGWWRRGIRMAVVPDTFDPDDPGECRRDYERFRERLTNATCIPA